jgi:hypothetical protein
MRELQEQEAHHDLEMKGGPPRVAEVEHIDEARTPKA